MIKKISLLLMSVILCTNMGITSPVSAQNAEEDVIVESNFSNCNLGAYTEENQTDGGADLRNGIVMLDDSKLSAGYTIKDGNEYENISEADIVYDGGEKVLRLNTFLSTSYDVTSSDSYPIVKSNGKIPKNGKVKIDIEVKMSPRVTFHLHHSKPIEGNFRIWRLENGNATLSKIRVLESTDTGRTATCNEYNMYTAIMDTATGEMSFYLNGEFIYTAMGKVPSEDRELFFKHVSLNDASVKPTPIYNAEDNTKIESVVNPQYVYIKSLKMTTYTDTTLEGVTPAYGSRVMTPAEAVFTFTKDIKSVEKAEVYDIYSGESVDVTSSLIFEGQTVRVPYAFEEDRNYEVIITGASDGLTSTDASTSFETESWNFSNITENPVDESPEDNSRIFINEDFTNSDNENIISDENRNDGWFVGGKGDSVSIVELEDGDKALQIPADTTETLFQIQYNKSLNLLDNTTTLSFDIYMEKDTRSFAVYREVNGAKYLETNSFKGYWAGKNMTDGKWHKVVITFSDVAGTSLYVDGELLQNTPKSDSVPGLETTGYFRFVTILGDVKIDNLKLYLDKNKTALTAVTPSFDAMDVKTAEPIVFTYNEPVGDVSGTQLIIKPNYTNEAIVLTNGNGMSVSSEGNEVIITLDNALKEKTGYALELSGIKNTKGLTIDAVKTRFSTVFDSSWEAKDFESTVQGVSLKEYSIKVKNEIDAEGALMAVAVYDENGNLENVVFSEPAVSGNEWAELTATVNYKEGNTSKIFVWDSLEDMNLIIGIISD